MKWIASLGYKIEHSCIVWYHANTSGCKLSTSNNSICKFYDFISVTRPLIIIVGRFAASASLSFPFLSLLILKFQAFQALTLDLHVRVPF